MVSAAARPAGGQPYGKVYLVGAGPGDPGLFTLRGKGLLDCADVVIHDALVSAPILAMINPQAQVIDVGKRRGRHALVQEDTNQLIIDQAKAHAVVVRLKGGDPFVFGRGGEEMAALVAVGIAVEVVPGITAGVAVPAYAGIPITHRSQSSSVTFVTGHESAGKYRPRVNWRALAQGSETIVVYMGIHNLGTIAAELLAAELSPETPVALIRWGTYPQQETLIGTLATIVAQVAEKGFEAPAIAVIGHVVSWHEIFRHSLPTSTIWPA